MDPALMVLVPHYLPARASTLTEALSGTAIHVVVDRRRRDRRKECQAPTVDRRQCDRRGEPRIVAYVYACPVIAVDPPSTSDPAPESRPGNLAFGIGLRWAGA
jgi:hypothetical protein